VNWRRAKKTQTNRPDRFRGALPSKRHGALARD
jgi:hypothetical protein